MSNAEENEDKGVCGHCGSTERNVHEGFCQNCKKQAITTGSSMVKGLDDNIKVEEYEEIDGEGDGGQYELTVTEDALVRLHGLSLDVPVPCDLCPPGTAFYDLDEFDAHMSGHAEAKMFACQLCTNTYKSWSNLIAHRKVFHQGEVLSCEECSSRRSHARLEGAVHYPIDGKPHGCEECNIGLDNVNDVYRHFWAHIAPPGSWKMEGVVTVGKAAKKKCTYITKKSVAHRDKVLMEKSFDIVQTEAVENNSAQSSLGTKTENPAATSLNQRNYKHSCPHCFFSCEVLDEYRSHITRNARVHGCTTSAKVNLPKGEDALFSDHEYCHSGIDQFDCPPCLLLFPSENSFDMHLKSVHSNCPKMTCCSCGRSHPLLELTSHIKACRQKLSEWESRKRIERRTCQLCGKIFRRVGALRKHKKLHDSNNKRQFDCATCGRSFLHGGAYAKHIAAYPGHRGKTDAAAGSQVVNFVCEYCGRTFTKKEALKVHLMRHSGVKPHVCPNCSKAFLSRTALSVHVRLHTGERPYMCEVCGKNFTGSTSLYVHQRMHRMKVDEKISTKQTCPVCLKVLSSKLVYEGHVRQHTGERPFGCTVCGKRFTTLRLMKTHAKRHAGGKDKVYLCHKCGLALFSPKDLEEHAAAGHCSGDETSVFVLPTSGEITYVDSSSVVEILTHTSTTEVIES